MLAVILFIKNEIKFAKKYICILFYMSLYLSACVRFLASCIISRRSLVKSSALKKIHHLKIITKKIMIKRNNRSLYNNICHIS